MRQYLNKYFTAILLCIFLAAMPAGHAYAQNDTTDEQSETEQVASKENRSLTAAEWNEISNDKDYYYRDSSEYKKEIAPKDVEKEPAFAKWLTNFFMWLGSFWGQIIIWGLLILIVLYAVYRVVAGETSGLFSKRSKSEGATAEQPNTEDINETNWEKLRQNAAKDGDLRLAVRYSYMLLLQVLQHNELIQYRNDKTNYEYYSELADTPYKQTFRQLSRQYEYTWYGNFPISQDTYDGYMTTLNDLKKQLGR